ncbi:undecaprenyl-phosphate glucose phosphotransferase [Gilvimarinus sp. F26214L]|uniref:undecaprenyl-phosphate glucose phosphotransferase n=1 Tax=Gilvimarinus sp. DZF01 TaxID=3461371 RepID=UPI0040465555
MVFWIQWLLGVTLHLGLLLGLVSAKMDSIPSHYQIAAVIAVLASIPIYSVCRVYSVFGGYLVGLTRLLVGWSTLIGSLVFLAFVTKTSELFSREVILQWATIGYALQGLAFLPIHRLVQGLGSRIRGSRRTVIVGTDRLARTLADSMGDTLVGLVSAEGCGNQQSGSHRVLGDLSRLRDLLKEHRVSRVYIALPAEKTSEIESLYVDLLDANVDVVWVPDIANLMLLNHSVQSVGGLPVVHLNESPLTSHPGSALLKLLVDRVLAALGIIVLSPVLIATAIAVKCSSSGPILFRQKRHGWNGNIIEVLKFRSMYVHQDSHVKQAQKGDPRVTPVGRFIRRTSIDELPQLFNVLKGEMSLVGPRPHAVAHNDYYADKIRAYMARHRIKPGITGYAQINGYRGETETLEKMQKRVELDLEYINNWSLWLDLQILLKTPLSLFSKNIY